MRWYAPYLAIMAIGLSLDAGQAQVPGQFHCPKAGTITEGAPIRSYVTYWGRIEPLSAPENSRLAYSGADPTDPAYCIVTLPNGRRGQLLFNWYNTEGWVSDSDGSVRSAMTALMSGEEKHVAFDYALAPDPMDFTQVGGRLVRNSWTRLGTETVTIGDFPFTTIVYRWETSGLAQGHHANGWGSEWKLWFAPEAGVFIRGKLLSSYGRDNATLKDWTVKSIQIPGDRVSSNTMGLGADPSGRPSVRE